MSQDVCTYRVRVRGEVNEGEINALSPLCVTVEVAEPPATQVAVRTDQAGLIGLLCHLHGLGFTLLSVDCEL